MTAAAPSACSTAEVPRLIPDLLSIVLWVEQGRPFLDECLFAVTGQSYRPVELIAVARGTDADPLRRMLEQYSRIEPFEYRVLVGESQRADALNSAILQARGGYLGFLSADQVVFPEHYARLVQKIGEGDAAWAISSFLRAYVDDQAGGASFIRWKQESALRYPFDLSFFQYNRPIGCAIALDRTRLGRFPLVFSNNEGPLQNDPLFVKLAAVFWPAVVIGPPSCEQRMSKGARFDDLPQAVSGLRLLAAIERGKVRFRLRSPRLYQVAKRISEWGSKLLSGKSLRENVDRLSRGGR